jgi:hypothetical protein
VCCSVDAAGVRGIGGRIVGYWNNPPCPPLLIGEVVSPGGDPGCTDRDGLVQICLQSSTAGIEAILQLVLRRAGASKFWLDMICLIARRGRYDGGLARQASYLAR